MTSNCASNTNFNKVLPQKGDDERSHDIVIPVMGLTGVGKSTFINTVIGPNASQMAVGYEIESCTLEVAIVEVDASQLRCVPGIRGRRLFMVDTPGFDGTGADDTEVLAKIAKWLEESYRNQVVVGGVIYLHDISIARFTGSAKKNLAMLNRLCGEGALDKVVLGATKSDRLDSEEATTRFARLKDVHWKDMVDKGAQIFQFEGSRESALNLVNAVMTRFGERTVLEIQRELVDKKLLVPETKAGRELGAMFQQVLGGGDESQIIEAEGRIKEWLAQMKVPLSQRLRTFLGH